MHQLTTSNGPPDLGAAAARRSSVSAADDVRAGLATASLAERALEVAYRTALGVTRDPQLASDIAQDVAIKALQRAKDLRDPEALGAWLHRTTVRAAIDQHRRTRRRRAAEDGFASAAPQSHRDDDPYDSALELLAILPDRQRAAMTLRHVHDLSDRQIAHALGCRTGTARSLLSRATATLRDRLATTATSKADR
ncbi:sigma-70 family RNA polymerase sigma factor [Patulibacter sp. NPDC049589]|uniref:RNA polymerase sigma factor n=1 Tax=Patulibacter sp. NPDC049589 TaxID=3154731 RepID=UPI003416C32F